MGKRLKRGIVPYHEISPERMEQLEDPLRLKRGIADGSLPSKITQIEREKRKNELKKPYIKELIGHMLTLKAYQEAARAHGPVTQIDETALKDPEISSSEREEPLDLVA